MHYACFYHTQEPCFVKRPALFVCVVVFQIFFAFLITFYVLPIDIGVDLCDTLNMRNNRFQSRRYTEDEAIAVLTIAGLTVSKETQQIVGTVEGEITAAIEDSARSLLRRGYSRVK
jgi:hypothetical protein